MQLRGLISSALGLGIAGSAVLYTHATILAPQDAPRAGTALGQVVVASSDAAFGQIITADLVELRRWPTDAVPDGAFTSLESLLGSGTEQERRARRSIAAGEVLLSNKVSGFGEKVTITELLDPEMRAVAIRVNDVTGVAGFVTPGDRVDVTLTRTFDKGLHTTTILQGIKVLGTDQIADKDRDKPSVVRTVTVEAAPADVQRLALAQQAGTLSLSLRHNTTVDQPKLPAITVSDLSLDRPRSTRPVAAAPSVTVNRAGERS